MTRFFTFFAFVFLSFVTVSNAVAASSEWQDLGGGEARLIANMDPATGTIKAAVEVRLEPGWVTYWRYPGSTGIPPNFDFSSSSGFEAGPIRFPAPTLLGEKDIRYAGYKKSVVFPLEGKVYDNVKSDLHLKMLIGVCAEICIPAQAEMRIPHSALLQSDPLTSQIIKLAEMKIPQIVDAENIGVDAQLRDKKLVVTVNHGSSNITPSLFVEGPSDWYLQPAKLEKTEDGKAVFALDVSSAPKSSDIITEQLRYTLVTGATGFEFTR